MITQRVPGFNIPITEKTELLTTPIDTGITKHNVETCYMTLVEMEK